MAQNRVTLDTVGFRAADGSLPSPVEEKSMLPFSFPLDLERDIFEFAARDDREMALQLVLVSKLVQRWVDPILYERVWLASRDQADQFIVALDSKPAPFFYNVKVLCLAYPVGRDRAEKILPLCTALVGFACWVPNLLTLATCRDKSPRRISFNFSLGEYTPHRVVPDFAASLFANITHLEFVDDTEFCTEWEGFDLIPHLTHLSFVWAKRFPLSTPPPHAQLALETCPQLRILLLLRPGFSGNAGDGLKLFNDPRAVILKRQSQSTSNIRSRWEKQWTPGETDIWNEAEVIAEKQAKMI
ncbi:hypothetical protein HGRIS_012363 [Hohenbuehelia grisea]|uniref:F-box domain-containing protein n=1 Tax=Hohenbuehelia grisea TaxID=104357 RepID=A0ABR3IS28_9AGAR